MSGMLSLHAGEISGDALARLEADVAARERALAALRADLLSLQQQYLAEVGVLYADLGRLEHELRDAEIRAGLRLPEDIDTDEPDDEATASTTVGGANAAAPPDDLKRVFRDVARAVHPDLALDEIARCRRHSLMAEANRAYAERDADRLRLILQAFEQDDEALPDEGDWRRRSTRRAKRLRERLVHLDRERAELERSAIARLRNKIAEARAQGWDLWAEMLQQVRRDIGATSAKIAKLRLQRA